MKRLKLSNGWIIEACVGDGFDGSSGVYFLPPKDLPGHVLDPQSLEVPEKDALPVARLLNWYAKAEMGLRLAEGTIYPGMGHLDGTKSQTIENCSQPYQAVYWAGSLLSLSGQSRIANKGFPIQFPIQFKGAKRP